MNETFSSHQGLICSVITTSSSSIVHFFSGAGSQEMLTSKVNWSPALHLISFKLVLSILGGTFLALHVTGPASLDGSLCPPALIALTLNS